jgi:hypothetical protein
MENRGLSQPFELVLRFSRINSNCRILKGFLEVMETVFNVSCLRFITAIFLIIGFAIYPYAIELSLKAKLAFFPSPHRV